MSYPGTQKTYICIAVAMPQTVCSVATATRSCFFYRPKVSRRLATLGYVCFVTTVTMHLSTQPCLDFPLILALSRFYLKLTQFSFLSNISVLSVVSVVNFYFCIFWRSCGRCTFCKAERGMVSTECIFLMRSKGRTALLKAVTTPSVSL